MHKGTLKSIWAILAGFILVVILSIATDIVLTKTGIMKQPFDLNSTGFIVFVILYRCLFGIIGSYLTARLAPGKPLKHSIIGGVIGVLIATIGAIVMWEQPHWYPITIIITPMPCAWLGAIIFIKTNQNEERK